MILRRPEERDIEACGRICYEGFRSIAERHGFPPDFPNPTAGSRVIRTLLDDPGFFGVVAENDGIVVGSNWLEEHASIAGIGPITVDPAVQDTGIGRQLMQAVIDRSDERGFLGVRLVQAAYHARSLSLYTKLGFVSREELAVMSGTPARPSTGGYQVRPLIDDDLAACNQLCTNAYGFHRGTELRSAVAAGNAFVATRDGAPRAYTSGLGYFGHSVGESVEALCALLASAPRLPSLGVLVPVRNYALFRWCLDNGMRVVMTMTHMSRGIYQEPEGPYLPSINF